MGNILWLASYPKSGNTWLRAFLANLVANRREPLPLADLTRYCEDDALPAPYTKLAGRPSVELGLSEIAMLRPRVHAVLAARHEGTIFVKTHNLAGSLDNYPLQNIDVTAGAIYIVRNPLDVAVSMTYHFDIDIDRAIQLLAEDALATENNTLFVTQILGSWSHHVTSWTSLSQPRVLVLRFEDMLEKPVKVFGKVARLVGLNGEINRVALAIRHSTFHCLSELEKRDGFVEAVGSAKKFFRAGRINQWRSVLTREQVAQVVAQHREQMSRFRYIPAGY